MDVVFALTGTKQDAFSAITTQVVGGVDTNCVCQATGITDSRLLFTRDTAPLIRQRLFSLFALFVYYWQK
jgi:hypothetical protein